MVCWFVGLLVCLLVCLFVGLLVGLFVGWFVGWFVCLVGLLFGCFVSKASAILGSGQIDDVHVQVALQVHLEGQQRLPRENQRRSLRCSLNTQAI